MIYIGTTAMQLLVTIIVTFFTAAEQLSLTSSPPSNGPICPGPIQFTCTGTEVGQTLRWRVNGTNRVMYGFDGTDSFINYLDPRLLGVEVMIVNTSLSRNDSRIINIVSILSSNVSILKGSMIQCHSSSITSEVLNVTEIGGNYENIIAPCTAI